LTAPEATINGPTGETAKPGAGGINIWDSLPLVVTAALLGWVCQGHYVKPHADFHEFRESGAALIAGEIPPTFKRGPVYPVLIALAGKTLGRLVQTETPADQLVAGWLNGFLLPCNVLLIYLIGRRWIGSASRWPALWFSILPIGLYCTTHLLVEPLLTATALLTVWLGGRQSRWAYLAASLAIMTRYDAAGLLAGLVGADLLHRRKITGVAWRCGLALAPLAIWLTLTAITWQQRSTDHYLTQIAEHEKIDVARPVRTALAGLWPDQHLATPVWIAEYGSFMHDGVSLGMILAAMLGAGVLFFRREPAALIGGGFLAGYWAVHAVFPFQFARFGYPAAPLLLCAAGMGFEFVRLHVSKRFPSRSLHILIFGVVIAATGVFLCAEIDRVRMLLALPRQWIRSLPYIAALGVIAAGLIPRPKRGAIPHRLLLTAIFSLVAVFFTRQAMPMLGDGRERLNVVHAARWLRDNLQPGEGVLCDEPGLQRMYANDSSVDRFVGFGGVEAEEWPEIVKECRCRGLCYIVWHDRIFAEQGAYYIRKWRLERFARLENPEQASGLVLVEYFEGRPNVWLYRVSNSAAPDTRTP